MRIKFWQSDGFIFYCMGVVLMGLALYILTGEAVVRRVEWTPMEQRLTLVEQRVMRLEAPPILIVKKRWWQR